MFDLDLMRAADARLASPDQWARGELHRDEPDEPEGWCMLGALYPDLSFWDKRDEPCPETVALAEAIHELYPKRAFAALWQRAKYVRDAHDPFRTDAIVAYFNDSDKTTFEDVKRVYAHALAKAVTPAATTADLALAGD